MPLTGAGFEPLVLKGLALVDRYPAPRPSSDGRHRLLVPPRLSRRRRACSSEPAGARAGTLGARSRLRPGLPASRHPRGPPRAALRVHRVARDARPARRTCAVGGSRADVGLRAPGVGPAAGGRARRPRRTRREGLPLFSRLLWIADLVVLEATSDARLGRGRRDLSRARRRAAERSRLRHAERLGADVPERMLTLPPAFERSRRLRAILDPARPFGSARRPRWMAYVLVDGVPGKLRFVAEDLRHPTEGPFTRAHNVGPRPSGLRRLRRLASERAPVVASDLAALAGSRRTP